MIKQLKQGLKQLKASHSRHDAWDLQYVRDCVINALRRNEFQGKELRKLKKILDTVDDVLYDYLDSAYGWPDYKVWHELLPGELQDPSDKERIRKQFEDECEMWYADRD